MHVELAVVGGGPAGGTVAVQLARRGHSVALFEAGEYSESRVGETLPPEINPLLRQLGLWEVFLESTPLESPGIISFWGSTAPAELDFIRNPYGSGWHVDRRRLDACIVDEAERSGVAVRRSTRVSAVEKFAAGWRLRTSAGDECTSDVLIDATGRSGLRIPGVSPRRAIDDALVGVWFRFARENAERDQRALIESAPDGWWYSSPLPDGDIVATYITERQNEMQPAAILAELTDAPATRARLGHSTLITARVMPVLSSLREELTGSQWCAVGDAACTYDPLSGLGVLSAMQSARFLVESYVTGDFVAFQAKVQQSFRNYVSERRKNYGMERRWQDRSFWRGRAASESPSRSEPTVV